MPIDNNSLVGTCILDINECASNPCKHGATCNDHINMYNCTCPPGYYGYNCQKGKYYRHILSIYTVYSYFTDILIFCIIIANVDICLILLPFMNTTVNASTHIFFFNFQRYKIEESMVSIKHKTDLFLPSVY